MGRALAESSPAAAAVWAEADAALGFGLSTLCFEGPAADLALTANTQPAVLTTSVAAAAALAERGVIPGLVAGHSLGEYSALVIAGALRFEEAVRLVRRRGQHMQQAVPVGQGAMAAVLGGELSAIERACAETEGVVEPVNYNCPGQLVIAGERAAVERASERIKQEGAKVRPLPVSAPFHCRLMQPAEERFRPDLERANLRDPGLPVYVNVDAVPVRTAAAARDALVRQISRPVRWEQSIRKLLEDGVTLFVEIGVGKALAGMIKRIDKATPCIGVEAPADLAVAREAIRAQR